MGSVVPLSGFKERFSLGPVEAEQEASAALAVMASYSERARTPGVRREKPATPTPSAYDACSHTLSCAPFWRWVSPEWAWTAGEAVRGTVLCLMSGGAVSWHGEVAVRGGTLKKGVYSIGGNRPVPLVEGEWFVATGRKVVERGEKTMLVATDYTCIRRMRGAGDW